jgi:molybdopterin synthase catalytic subunit
VTRITREPIRPQELLDHVTRADCGGVALFLGAVREVTGDVVTAALEYECHERMAVAELERIAKEAADRWPVRAIAVVHRVGRLDVGEIAVAVAASAPHRAEAFDATRYVIEELKRRAPIWKKEISPDGSSHWVGSEKPSG